jgi:hypothetical protein
MTTGSAHLAYGYGRKRHNHKLDSRAWDLRPSNEWRGARDSSRGFNTFAPPYEMCGEVLATIDVCVGWRPSGLPIRMLRLRCRWHELKWG